MIVGGASTHCLECVGDIITHYCRPLSPPAVIKLCHKAFESKVNNVMSQFRPWWPTNIRRPKGLDWLSHITMNFYILSVIIFSLCHYAMLICCCIESKHWILYVVLLLWFLSLLYLTIAFVLILNYSLHISLTLHCPYLSCCIRLFVCKINLFIVSFNF